MGLSKTARFTDGGSVKELFLPTRLGKTVRFTQGGLVKPPVFLQNGLSKTAHFTELAS